MVIGDIKMIKLFILIFINLIILSYAFYRWITSSWDISSLGRLFFLLTVLWCSFIFWVSAIIWGILK